MAQTLLSVLPLMVAAPSRYANPRSLLPTNTVVILRPFVILARSTIQSGVGPHRLEQTQRFGIAGNGRYKHPAYTLLVASAPVGFNDPLSIIAEKLPDFELGYARLRQSRPSQWILRGLRIDVPLGD